MTISFSLCIYRLEDFIDVSNELKYEREGYSHSDDGDDDDDGGDDDDDDEEVEKEEEEEEEVLCLSFTMYLSAIHYVFTCHSLCSHLSLTMYSPVTHY